MKYDHLPQLFYCRSISFIFAIQKKVENIRNQILIVSGVILYLISIDSVLNAQQWGDYTLYSGKNSTSAYLIDTNSAVFHTWSFSSNAKTGYSAWRNLGKNGRQTGKPTEWRRYYRPGSES
jgi:hypothetical protein